MSARFVPVRAPAPRFAVAGRGVVLRVLARFAPARALAPRFAVAGRGVVLRVLARFAAGASVAGRRRATAFFTLDSFAIVAGRPAAARGALVALVALLVGGPLAFFFAAAPRVVRTPGAFAPGRPFRACASLSPSVRAAVDRRPPAAFFVEAVPMAR